MPDKKIINETFSKAHACIMENFDFASLEITALDCEECGWAGIGHETEKGYAQLPEAIEIYCPVCGNYFGQVKKSTGRET